MRSDLLTVVVVTLALGAQYALTTFSVGWMDVRAFVAMITPSIEPVRPPVRMPVAMSEREINEQQAASAARLAESLGTQPSDDATLQADDVRKQTETPIQVDLSMRCGEKLPPESAWTTRGVEIFVRSAYHGEQRGAHNWKYRVAFTNRGVDTVQMLTRHWVFTDAMGAAQQMKGPGARGVTPVLGPGDSWEYESGTSLPTPTGSLHGSFQMQVITSRSGEMPHSFSARVARLALTSDHRGVMTPCPEEADETLLAPTSVRATQRIIVGATATYSAAHSTPGAPRWIYDVQINNALPYAVTVVGHRWVVQTAAQAAAGEVGEVTQGEGVGGTMKAREMRLPAGEAFRVRGLLAANAPLANARGHYVVRLHRPPDDAIVGETDADGQAGVADKAVNVQIGALGLRAADDPRREEGVPDFQSAHAPRV